MMTPQEVAGCTFTKAVMGGYNMAAVDDFLDKLTEDYSALYRENAELTGKIKTLAAKLEEYREIENAINSTLLTAQMTANELVAEAEKKRDALLADAPKAAEDRMAEINREVAAEEQRLWDKKREVSAAIREEDARLAQGQAQLRDFISAVQSVCNRQLALLDDLPELPPLPQVPESPEPPVAEDEEIPVPVYEDSVLFTEDAADEAEENDTDEAENSVDADEVEKNVQDAINALVGRNATEDCPADSSPFNSDDMSATRPLNLEDLQFGRNYTRE